jgi:uncharacterized protein YbjT (DUF2867 family)
MYENEIPTAFVRTPPSRILIFGATGRTGPWVADRARNLAPDVTLRLVARNSDAASTLAARHPGAEVVIADLLDRPSLDSAVESMDGVYLVTPSFLDEKRAMSNLVDALQRSGAVRHIVRILGDVINVPLHRVPPVLRDVGGGTAIQHMTAHDILENSSLPVTYLNIAATFMDNLLKAQQVLETGEWVWPLDRLIGYVDPRDVGEIAARILLSHDSRHIGQRYNVDNGHDLLRVSDVAKMLSDEFGRDIKVVVSEQRFIDEVGPALDRRFGREGGGQYMCEYLRFEQANEVVWRRTDFAETILRRPPTKLLDWIREHREMLQPDGD